MMLLPRACNGADNRETHDRVRRRNDKEPDGSVLEEVINAGQYGRDTQRGSAPDQRTARCRPGVRPIDNDRQNGRYDKISGERSRDL